MTATAPVVQVIRALVEGLDISEALNVLDAAEERGDIWEVAGEFLEALTTVGGYARPRLAYTERVRRCVPPEEFEAGLRVAASLVRIMEHHGLRAAQGRLMAVPNRVYSTLALALAFHVCQGGSLAPEEAGAAA